MVRYEFFEVRYIEMMEMGSVNLLSLAPRGRH
jgi:hypothetical protein